MVYAGERPVALFAWSAAARYLGPRDRYLGWHPEVRRRNVRSLAYNTRYLILPWLSVPHLASQLLSRMTRMLSAEWEKVYGHPVYCAQTFVDTTRLPASPDCHPGISLDCAERPLMAPRRARYGRSAYAAPPADHRPCAFGAAGVPQVL
jgi:hypothetical protein